MTASTSSTLRPTTAGTLVAGFPRGRFYASPGTRVLSFSRASSTTLPADALRGPGPLGAREGAGDVAAGRIERSARPLPVAGAGLDQAAQRLVCGAAPRAVLDGHLIARQADRAVDVADGTGPASSRTPYPTAEQAGPQVLRAPVAAALSSPPPDPLPGLAAALRGLTHEAARFPQLIIIYDQIPDRRRGRGFATGIHLNEALEWSKRPGPGLGYAEGYTHDYVRHGTTTLFAALDIATGEVFGLCRKRHRHEEFLSFLRLIDREVPAELDIHLATGQLRDAQARQDQAVAGGATTLPPALHAHLGVLVEPGGAVVRVAQPAGDQAGFVPQRHRSGEQDPSVHRRLQYLRHTVRLGRHGAIDHRQSGADCDAYFRDSTLANRNLDLGDVHFLV